VIKRIEIKDTRFNLESGAGSDAIHRDPVYSYAVTNLIDDSGIIGTGFAFTLGEGNDLVCIAAKFYAEKLIGKDIEELMSHSKNISNINLEPLCIS
jgi:L-fuconate dehydratase